LTEIMAKVDQPWEFRPPGSGSGLIAITAAPTISGRWASAAWADCGSRRAQLHADGGAPNEHFDIWRGLAGYSSIVQCAG
jgi:hypothetical protein